jgi:hypothetical protein
MNTTNLRQQLKAEALAMAESDARTSAEWFHLEEESSDRFCACGKNEGGLSKPGGRK